ncbi:conserved hypothetical protein [Escherichia coli]|nr:hypothetical protein EA410_25440 [Escherichia coli]SOQ61485.1 conserved hypothetical protein [Escherichia coli]SOQ65985.1 conserved hypothetical protein [Escherichia coli]SOQ73075.1 conserved hypothetical protein [Escherichia coli]SOQ76663.1 conserved hypothetical protein [Escherichia coli]
MKHLSILVYCTYEACALMQLVAICMQPMTLIRKTWEKIATEILSLNVITPAFEKLRWKSNLGKPPCPELIPEMLS